MKRSTCKITFVSIKPILRNNSKFIENEKRNLKANQGKSERDKKKHWKTTKLKL